MKNAFSFIFPLLAVLSVSWQCSGGSGGSRSGRDSATGATPRPLAKSAAQPETNATASNSVAAACAKLGTEWHYNEEKKSCLKLADPQSGEDLCKTKGEGWAYNKTAKTCDLLDPTSSTVAGASLCSTKGAEWVYDSVAQACNKIAGAKYAKQLCSEASGGKGVLDAATGVCISPTAFTLTSEPSTDTVCAGISGGSWVYRAEDQTCVNIAASLTMDDLCKEQFGASFAYYESANVCSTKNQSVPVSDICAAIAKKGSCAYDGGSDTFGPIVEELSDLQTCQRMGTAYIYKAGPPAVCNYTGSSVPNPSPGDDSSETTQHTETLPTTVGEAVAGTTFHNNLKELDLVCPAGHTPISFEIQRSLWNTVPALNWIELLCYNTDKDAEISVSVGQKSTAGEQSPSKVVPCGVSEAVFIGLKIAYSDFILDIIGADCAPIDKIQRSDQQAIDDYLADHLANPNKAGAGDPMKTASNAYMTYLHHEVQAIPPLPPLENDPGASSLRSCDDDLTRRRFLQGLKVKYLEDTVGKKAAIASLQLLCIEVQVSDP